MGTNGKEISRENVRKILKLLNFRKRTIQPTIPEISGGKSNGTEIFGIPRKLALFSRNYRTAASLVTGNF